MLVDDIEGESMDKLADTKMINKIEKLQDEDEKLTKGILTLEDEVCFAKRRLLRDSKI